MFNEKMWRGFTVMGFNTDKLGADFLDTVELDFYNDVEIRVPLASTYRQPYGLKVLYMTQSFHSGTAPVLPIFLVLHQSRPVYEGPQLAKAIEIYNAIA
jgi:hypothetical protein